MVSPSSAKAAAQPDFLEAVVASHRAPKHQAKSASEDDLGTRNDPGCKLKQITALLATTSGPIEAEAQPDFFEAAACDQGHTDQHRDICSLQLAIT